MVDKNGIKIKNWLISLSLRNNVKRPYKHDKTIV